MDELTSLFSPGTIGGLRLKNRIVMSPMAVNYAGLDGSVSDALVDYIAARARGGVGAIIVEAAVVDSPAGKESLGQLRIDHPRYILGLYRLAQTIKTYNCGAFIQLFHAGRQTTRLLTDGVQPVAPSPIPCGITREMPRELLTDEIPNLIQKFVTAATYAHMAGFDGVELHAAHGYLLNEFLSPQTNQRHDRYGGSRENRTRMLVEIIQGIKSSLPDLCLSVRLNIDDFTEQGLNPYESVQIARDLAGAGADAINCSCGIYESGLNSIEPSSYEEGWRIYLAEEVKKKVDIPVIAGGMLRSPVMANSVIAEGKADFVFLGRSLLADSEWPEKARKGKLEEIRPCITCNTCIEHNFKCLPVRCAVNPHTGREGQFDFMIKPSQKAGSAVVIGSGPGGMQAAQSLDRQGFKVTLFEKDDQPGGLLQLAAVPPFKQRILLLKDYMVRKIRRSNIELCLKHEFTPDDLKELNPDIAVIATGARPFWPDINGYNPEFCIDIIDVLSGSVDIRRQNVVIIGGGANGCEVADYLLCWGNRVTIVERQKYLASDMEKKNRRALMNRLNEGGVIKRTGSRVIKIMDSAVSIQGNEGIKETIPADKVVIAVGFVPDNQLYDKIINRVADVFLIGDALKVRGIEHAILEGENVGYAVFKTRNSW
ncbi:MAG TPA: NAD(P)/FAD-dependent oxidoreductase [Syntrophomonadaceae bacterium]|nr:NAD(P)/FAD-dependent oxidoreductase [Syntrophomonadaceae bacterium]